MTPHVYRAIRFHKSNPHHGNARYRCCRPAVVQFGQVFSIKIHLLPEREGSLRGVAHFPDARPCRALDTLGHRLRKYSWLCTSPRAKLDVVPPHLGFGIRCTAEALNTAKISAPFDNSKSAAA